MLQSRALPGRAEIRCFDRAVSAFEGSFFSRSQARRDRELRGPRVPALGPRRSPRALGRAAQDTAVPGARSALPRALTGQASAAATTGRGSGRRRHADAARPIAGRSDRGAWRPRGGAWRRWSRYIRRAPLQRRRSGQRLRTHRARPLGARISRAERAQLRDRPPRVTAKSSRSFNACQAPAKGAGTASWRRFSAQPGPSPAPE